MHDVEAEQGLIGAVLLNNELFGAVGERIAATDFFEPVHAELWNICTELISAGKKANPMTVTPFLPGDMKIGELSAKQYVARVCAAGAIPNEVAQLADMIRDLSDRRAMAEVAMEIGKAGSGDPAEVAGWAIEQLDGIVAARTVTGVPSLTLDQSVARAMDAAAGAYARDGAISGLSTGLRDLDRKLLGLQRGELIVLAGRPGSGKTAAALCVARNMASQGHKGIFYSLEMGDVQLSQRMLTDEMFDTAAIAYTKLRSGRFKEKDFEQLRDAAIRLQKLPMRIEQQPAMTLGQISARARQEKRRKGLDFFIVDYLGLMKSSGRYAGNRTNEIGELTSGIRALAKELDCVGLLLAQLNRGIEGREDKRPNMGDLRDCLTGDCLVVDADTGFRTPLINIVKDNRRFNVWALDENLRLVKKPILASWPVSKKPVYRVVTRSGRSLRCTAGHRFNTIHGWRELSDLDEGSFVAVPRIQSSPTMPGIPISPDKALLLGWLLGDGYLGGSACLTVATRDEAEIASALAHKEFGINPIIKPERADTSALKVVMTTGRMCGAKKNPLTSWLRDLGVWQVTGQEKFIPETIFSQSNDVVAAFLRGLFHADGSLSCKKSRAHLRLSTISPWLADGVRHLLLRFGLNAMVSADTRNIGGYRTTTKAIYTIGMAQVESVSNFMKIIGFLGAKHAKALGAMGNRSISLASQFDRIPKDVNEHVTSLRLERGISHAALGWREQGKAMSRETAALLGHRLKDNFLLSLGNSEVLWDEIVAITPDGEEMTYDLTVADAHNFSVNDIITHNSGNIEQDADVIIMIYREAYYLERKEPPIGSAEHLAWQTSMERCLNEMQMIVEKQRMGPVGSIKVFCDVASNAIRDAGYQRTEAYDPQMAF